MKNNRVKFDLKGFNMTTNGFKWGLKGFNLATNRFKWGSKGFNLATNGVQKGSIFALEVRGLVKLTEGSAEPVRPDFTEGSAEPFGSVVHYLCVYKKYVPKGFLLHISQ